MPRRGAGRFLTQALFETRAGGGDVYGNPDIRWVSYARRRCLFTETPAGEGLEGGVLQSHTRATLRCRRDALMLALPTDARVFVKNRYWSVVSIAEGDRHDTGERHTVTITVDQGPAT